MERGRLQHYELKRQYEAPLNCSNCHLCVFMLTCSRPFGEASPSRGKACPGTSRMMMATRTRLEYARHAAPWCSPSHRRRARPRRAAHEPPCSLVGCHIIVPQPLPHATATSSSRTRLQYSNTSRTECSRASMKSTDLSPLAAMCLGAAIATTAAVAVIVVSERRRSSIAAVAEPNGRPHPDASDRREGEVETSLSNGHSRCGEAC
jgi:hypothetical protein